MRGVIPGVVLLGPTAAAADVRHPEVAGAIDPANPETPLADTETNPGPGGPIHSPRFDNGARPSCRRASPDVGR